VRQEPCFQATGSLQLQIIRMWILCRCRSNLCLLSSRRMTDFRMPSNMVCMLLIRLGLGGVHTHMFGHLEVFILGSVTLVVVSLTGLFFPTLVVRHSGSSLASRRSALPRVDSLPARQGRRRGTTPARPGRSTSRCPPTRRPGPFPPLLLSPSTFGSAPRTEAWHPGGGSVAP
jgi:hypothetical protein